MYKQKTRKTVMKRFKITKTGKIMRGHHLARHKRITKSGSRRRRFKEPRQLTGKNAKIIRTLITS